MRRVAVGGLVSLTATLAAATVDGDAAAAAAAVRGAGVAAVVAATDAHPAPTGAAGTLWCWWATDAPQVTCVAAAIRRLRAARPEIAVHQQCLTPLSRLSGAGIDVAALHARAAAVAPGTAVDAAQLLAGDDLPLQAIPAACGASTSLPVLPDVSLAQSLGVRVVVTWGYRSPGGYWHVLEGAGPQLDLAQWVAHCQRFEADVAGADGSK
jgi:hypothetical protein